MTEERITAELNQASKESKKYVSDWPPFLNQANDDGFGNGEEKSSNSGSFVPHRYTQEELEGVSNIFHLCLLASGSQREENTHGSNPKITWEPSMAPSVVDYVNYGAEDEESLRQNRQGFARYALRPRVLKDVSKTDTSTTILQGRVRLSMPLCIAPFAGCTVHPDKEFAIAKAAADAGIGYTVPNLSGTPVRDLVEQHLKSSFGDNGPPPPFLFQIYPQKPKVSNEGFDREQMEAILRYLSSLGNGNNTKSIVGVILTCDTVNLGNRELTYKNPQWLIDIDDQVGGFPNPCALSDDSANLPDMSMTRFTSSMTWEDIRWMKRKCRQFELALILKGIMTKEDTKLAVEAGVDAVIVSNHGGRQLDGTLGTVEVVEECAQAARGSKTEIYVDGGIRRGKDIAKCLALGAKCVFVGRPIIWGLAAGGQQGVARALEIYQEELLTVLQLLGCSSPQQLTRDHVEDQRCRSAELGIRARSANRWILATLCMTAVAFAVGRYPSTFRR